jgi:single-stranded-DNA-specific exonuclease
MPLAIEASDPPAAVLGVERSISGKRWRARLNDERLGLAIAQRTGLPEIVGRILAARDVPLEAVEDYLNPTIARSLPDPSCLQGMDRAVDRLIAALDNDEPVAVFGDYDVDGATSAALLIGFFSAVGADLRAYIPDRLAEGYGPNAPALKRLASEGVRVVITVDCGITAHEALAEGKAAGLDVIVVDHHVAEPKLPPACAVINPNRLDDGSGLGQLAAVGVAFMLIVALNRRLRELGRYKDRPEPDLLRWLDLVALGTVCDVVPLTGLNRAFVAQGLKIMARRENRGIAALSDVAGLREPPGTFHAGFILGPRVNAGGRVGEAALGARLLSTADEAEARAIAARLDTYNTERREIEAAVLADAARKAEAQERGPNAPIIVSGHGWHPGVIGIVASRLVEQFSRPAIVIAVEGGVGKGSGRSVRGVDLGATVIAARQAGLLINGGGHRMAAGLTVDEQAIGALAEFLCQRIADDASRNGFDRSLGVDGALSLGAANPDLLEVLETLEPFGNGNPEPRFAFPRARIAKADIVGDNHIRCQLADEASGRLGAIAFRSVGTDLGQALLTARGGVLHLAGALRRNEWRGRSDVQLVIADAARP